MTAAPPPRVGPTQAILWVIPVTAWSGRNEVRPPRKDARALGTLDVNALRSPVSINVTDKASWPNCGGDWGYWLLCGS